MLAITKASSKTIKTSLIIKNFSRPLAKIVTDLSFKQKRLVSRKMQARRVFISNI